MTELELRVFRHYTAGCSQNDVYVRTRIELKFIKECFYKWDIEAARKKIESDKLREFDKPKCLTNNISNTSFYFYCPDDKVWAAYQKLINPTKLKLTA